MLMRWLAIALLTAACSQGNEPRKPPCNARNRGELWPKSTDRSDQRPIEMCTLNVWKYHWEQVTVSISQLAKDADRKGEHEAAHPAARTKDSPASN